MSDLLTREELDAIRQRAEAATPGPWEAEVHDGFCINGRPAECLVTAGNHLICKMLGPDAVTIYHPTTGFSTGHRPGANATFIAHAREDIPRLLHHIAAVEAQRDRAVAEAAVLGGLPVVGADLEQGWFYVKVPPAAFPVGAGTLGNHLPAPLAEAAAKVLEASARLRDQVRPGGETLAVMQAVREVCDAYDAYRAALGGDAE